jgi:hypothetical protein
VICYIELPFCCRGGGGCGVFPSLSGGGGIYPSLSGGVYPSLSGGGGVQEKNITKTKTKRIISESLRKNITKTKRIISESSRKNITKTKNNTNN